MLGKYWNSKKIEKKFLLKFLRNFEENKRIFFFFEKLNGSFIEILGKINIFRENVIINE